MNSRAVWESTARDYVAQRGFPPDVLKINWTKTTDTTATEEYTGDEGRAEREKMLNDYEWSKRSIIKWEQKT